LTLYSRSPGTKSSLPPVAEKNCTLIRYDILQSLRRLYDVVKDEAIRERAMALMETEKDLKYRRKYSSLWRGK
jgi:hypothetical protein